MVSRMSWHSRGATHVEIAMSGRRSHAKESRKTRPVERPLLIPHARSGHATPHSATKRLNNGSGGRFCIGTNGWATWNGSVEASAGDRANYNVTIRNTRWSSTSGGWLHPHRDGGAGLQPGTPVAAVTTLRGRHPDGGYWTVMVAVPLLR